MQPNFSLCLECVHLTIQLLLQANIQKAGTINCQYLTQLPVVLSVLSVGQVLAPLMSPAHCCHHLSFFAIICHSLPSSVIHPSSLSSCRFAIRCHPSIV